MKTATHLPIHRITRPWRLTRPNCDVTIVLRQRLAVITFVALIIWVIVQPAPLAWTGMVTLGSLLVFSYQWARVMASRVSSKRELRYTAVQVGDDLEEMLTLENRSSLPVVWAEFVDRSTAPGYSIAGVRVAGRHRTEQWRLHTTCTRRGVYTLGPWEVRMGDPFGLFEVQQSYREQTELVVYPPIAALPPEIAHQRRKIGDRLTLRQPLHAETINATATRPYVSGDSLRRVHWRTTARHDDMFVKVFEPEASSTMWLLPDFDSAVHLGEGNESSLEKMIVLLASIAARLLNERLAVGLLLDAKRADAVLPQAGQPHLWTILRALAIVQPQPLQPLAEAILHARSLISSRDSIVIVTPSLDPEWVKSLPMLSGASRTGGIEVVLLDPASFGGAGHAETFVTLLIEQGIVGHVVKREDIQPSAGTYGEVRRWEFMTLGTGRVVVRQTPRAASLPRPSLPT